jgi:lipoyl(octanoyl) transferase
MAEKICALYRLGLVNYQNAWDLQNRLAQEISRGDHPPSLLLLQHPHTYTFGRSGHRENLIWDQDELERRGISVHWVDRGGDITYHGPGQLVGYPLLPLDTQGLKVDPASSSARLPRADYVGYLRKLEEALIEALAQIGLAGQRVEGMTGVWLPPEAYRKAGDPPHEGKLPPAKVAAIGVKVDVHGVTRHGFALNVNPDMSYWEGIIGCGLEGYPVTSLAQVLPSAPSMESVSDAVVSAFGKVFEYEIKPVSEIEGPEKIQRLFR